MAEVDDVYIRWPDRCTSTEEVRWLGPNLARLESSPFVCPAIASYGDLVILEPDREDPGSTYDPAYPRYRYRRVYARAAYRTYMWVLSKEALATPEAEAVKARVVAEAGYWEQVMGGIFQVALPPTSTYDPQPDLDLVVVRLGAGEEGGQCGV